MVTLVNSMVGNHPARACLVLSNNPDAGGLNWARDLGIAAVAVDHRPFKGDRAAFEVELTAALEAATPDIICLAGFMRILTPDFITRWQGKMLNIHPSLLPKYPGLHTHLRALEAGEAEHGCTVHEVTAVLDDGPMVGQARVRVMANDTPETLSARVLEQEHRLYPAALRRFADGETTPVFLG